MAAETKINVYQEHQGTGSIHADPVTGDCWCAAKGNEVKYLNGKTKDEAVKEAALAFAVAEQEIELA